MIEFSPNEVIRSLYSQRWPDHIVGGVDTCAAQTAERQRQLGSVRPADRVRRLDEQNRDAERGVARPSVALPVSFN